MTCYITSKKWLNNDLLHNKLNAIIMAFKFECKELFPIFVFAKCCWLDHSKRVRLGKNVQTEKSHSHTNSAVSRQPYVSALLAGPSPGFSSRGGQKPERGAKNQKGGGTFLKYSVGCMQQPVGQTWNGGHRFQMGGPGTTGPPAGDNPAC